MDFVNFLFLFLKKNRLFGNLTKTKLEVVEISNFPFFLVGGKFEVVFLHKLRLGVLFGYQSLNKINLLIENLKLSSCRALFYTFDRLDEIQKLSVDIFLQDLYNRRRYIVALLGFFHNQF